MSCTGPYYICQGWTFHLCQNEKFLLEASMRQQISNQFHQFRPKKYLIRSHQIPSTRSTGSAHWSSPIVAWYWRHVRPATNGQYASSRPGESHVRNSYLWWRSVEESSMVSGPRAWRCYSETVKGMEIWKNIWLYIYNVTWYVFKKLRTSKISKNFRDSPISFWLISRKITRSSKWKHMHPTLGASRDWCMQWGSQVIAPRRIPIVTHLFSNELWQENQSHPCPPLWWSLILFKSFYDLWLKLANK